MSLAMSSSLTSGLERALGLSAKAALRQSLGSKTAELASLMSQVPDLDAGLFGKV